MLTTLMIGSVAAVLASPDTPCLTAEWLYNPVRRPVMIQIAAPPAWAELAAASLVLMDAEGRVIARPAPARPGWCDLAEVMPEVWRLNRAAFLQLVVDDRPVGSALVVQPMLSRMVPVTEQAISPSGAAYTHIASWHDERHPEQAAGEEAGKEETQGGAPDMADTAAAPERRTVPETGDRLLSGLRLYVERDVVLHTSAGDIRLAMRPDEAPNTVFNFLHLCEGGFYRTIAFHRVVPMTRQGEPFVIQAGDPTMTGRGGPGYWLPIEPGRLPHDFGVISMARDADPDSAGSQFFICLSREGTGRLDGDYCAFGYAVEGREAILAIAEVQLADVAAGRPVAPPVIENVELLPAPPRLPGVGRPDRPVTRQAEEEAKPADDHPGRVPR
jgi:peptidyl-prolyl cis-trans isomerase B (cyclophilin B)